MPLLRYRDELQAVRTHVLEGQRAVTIGRGAGVDVSIAWDPSVSSLHAEVVPLGEHWLIGDDGVSRNGTFVNGERVSGRRRLRDGDLVRIGTTTLYFHDPDAERPKATTISDSSAMTGLVTLLFTDLAGSTVMFAGVGVEGGEALRRAHFGVLRKAAAEHGGREVKSLGDGLMVAFQSAFGAASCAMCMQRRIAEQRAREHAGGERAGLRVGVNAGEAIASEDDYFGTPVVVAKRLCDRARPGQTLASEVVRSLVAHRREYRFIPVGELRLKGLADPVVAFELDWRAGAAAAQDGVD